MDSKLPGIVENIRQIIEKLKNLTPELQQAAAAVKNKIEKGE